MKKFQRLLKEHIVTQSISRKVNRLANSVMKNFFGRLNVESLTAKNLKALTLS